MRDTDLRDEITTLAGRLRTVGAVEREPQPRFVDYDRMRAPDGRVVGRKKVILMSGGCSVPTCTMCPFTNENNYGRPVDAGTLVKQVRGALARTRDEPGYEVVSLYNDGSFFAPKEVPAAVRMEIAHLVAASGVERLVVESLPQFVTTRAVGEFVAALGSVRLEVGIGLQSADDLVREVLVNTRITRNGFERAVAVLRETGVDPKIYLMIKPPFLTEAEAVTDVLSSVEYLAELDVRAVTLCPTRVSRDTVAWALWDAGLYTPPNLWTVVETVRLLHDRGAAVRVACVNLRGTDFESVFPDGCARCADRIVDALMRYGVSAAASDLPADCVCRPTLDPAPLDHTLIRSRVREQMDTLAGAGGGA